MYIDFNLALVLFAFAPIGIFASMTWLFLLIRKLTPLARAAYPGITYVIIEKIREGKSDVFVIKHAQTKEYYSLEAFTYQQNEAERFTTYREAFAHADVHNFRVVLSH